MRLGTPGFVSARLTEAREARGIAQAELAELTGIKPQSICHYEQGRQSPSPDALHFLSEKLSLPQHYFLKAFPSTEESGVLFHCLRPASRVVRAKAECRLSWTREVADYLRGYVDLPPVRLPSIAPGNSIEDAATFVRSYFTPGAGPIASMTLLLENHGFIVTRLESSDDHQGSCLQCFEGVPYLALADTKDPNIAAAHALGHLILHPHVAEEQLADPEGHETLEREADHFARAFLLPARSFGKEVWSPTIDALLSLKRTWHCPVSVMIRRCADLGIFDEAQVRRAFVNMGRRGWKTGEPQVEGTISETPEVLAKSIHLLFQSGLKDGHTLLAELALSAPDIEDLATLPRGYLRETEPLVALSPRLRHAV